MNKAVYNYENGHNCAQAILKNFSKELDMPEEELMRIGTGLGAGMYLGETCGAVTAGVIAIGLKKGSGLPNDKEKSREVIQDVKAFEKKFKEKYCSLNCKELKTTCKAKCSDIVGDSAEFLKEFLV